MSGVAERARFEEREELDARAERANRVRERFAEPDRDPADTLTVPCPCCGSGEVRVWLYQGVGPMRLDGYDAACGCVRSGLVRLDEYRRRIEGRALDA